MDAVGASYVISASYLFAMVANLLFGYLIDRFDRWKVMKVLLGLIIISALCMTIDNLLVFRIAVAMIIGLGLVCSNQVYGMGGDVPRGRDTGTAQPPMAASRPKARNTAQTCSIRAASGTAQSVRPGISISSYFADPSL